MGLSGSSMTPISAATDSLPPECPMHNKKPGVSPSAAAGECPASFGASQPVMSDVDPTNMVSVHVYVSNILAAAASAYFVVWCIFSLL